jgi:type I restriction enzyme M protein
VLGYVYEYLISNFAANAGKKAGEFYTPHEVAQVMSEIVAEDQKDKDHIGIYDPTSGSGSLLITIGKSVGKHIADQNKVVYYAQELKENTYNLTRMNLVMRGILPQNIHTRCADSLEEDWPVNTEGKDIGEPLAVDAVVSNPPYSQHWDPNDKELDARFANYGLAPKTKADYAFLLHELHHLKRDGILTIVMPHGVLFRGKAPKRYDAQGVELPLEQQEEGQAEGIIRANLIEKNNIDAIIGLPANIFFGTGIRRLSWC